MEFSDGEQQDIAYSILVEHMYTQIDTEGKQYRFFFVAIINHRKNSNAIDKDDQYRVVHGKQVKKRTTAGWQFEVEWKDGTTSWLPLKDLKETNPVELATYVIANIIDSEPALDWWTKELLHKQKRLIKLSHKHAIQTGYKFGLRLPFTVMEALEIDQESNNNLWHDAIMKEMSNVRVAFELRERNTQPPVGYKHIPMKMIFDIKMDFTRKALLVAGGHKTDPPVSLTYSSVVSRDSVRIAFLVAATNNLNIMMADIGNAYLNAKTEERVYAIAGAEFGDDKEGKIAIIVRALYGLKKPWSHMASSFCFNTP